MVNSARVKHYQKLLDGVQDVKKAVAQRWEDAWSFWNTAGFGEDLEEVTAAGVIPALVELALQDWPAGGAFSSSKSPHDKVEVVFFEERLKRKMVPRSMRHACFLILAKMANYRDHVLAMEAAGLFKPEAVPGLLLQIFPLTDWKQQTRGDEYQEERDQTQPLVVLMVSLLCNACRYSKTVADYVASHTAQELVKQYQDPITLLVEQHVLQRKALERRADAKRWSDDKLFDEMEALKDRQTEIKSTLCRTCDISHNLGYYFVRLYSMLLFTEHRISEDNMFRLIHEGGLINKLKNCMSFPMPGGGPGMAIEFLGNSWTKLCQKHSADLYKRVEAETAQSLELRRQGNSAFKEGQLKSALTLYWEALKHNPQDAALWNNIALVNIKLGKGEKALLAANEAVKVEPASSKTWCRLGDAYKLLSKWQLAHLCFTMALELAPQDDDIKVRQASVREHLEIVWDIDKDVPEPLSPAAGAWLRLPADVLGKLVRYPISGPSALQFLEGRAGESRAVAVMDIKDGVQRARAAAVVQRGSAAGLPAVCRSLKPPQQLPMRPGAWSLSWSDLPLRNKKTGLVRHVLSVAEQLTGQTRANLVVLGTPGVEAVRQLLIAAFLTPKAGRPARPMHVFVAYRLFPLFCQIQEMCQAWGIDALAETQAEAWQSARDNDTDPAGYNHAADVTDESYTSSVARIKRDPFNGHKKEAPAAAKAAAAASTSAAEAAGDNSPTATDGDADDTRGSNDVGRAGSGGCSSSSKPKAVRVGAAHGSGVKAKRVVPSVRKS